MLAALRVLRVLFFHALVGVEFSGCFEDFFIVNKYLGSQYYCVTNSSYALSWILDETATVVEDLQQESKFLPISYNFWNVGCQEFRQHRWECQNLFSTETTLDRRWEGIKVYKTDYVENEKQHSPLIFTTVDKTLPASDFEISMSIRTKQEAHIFLCDGEDVTTSNCYWMLLQGFKGKTSAIRKCPSKTIPLENEKPPEPSCKSFKTRVNHNSENPKFLSEKKWNHFILSKVKNELTLKKQNGQNILSYKDTDYNVYQTKYLILHSKNTTGLWKIHIIDYFKTTQTKRTEFSNPIHSINGRICVSMFVSMCENCTMRLEFKSTVNSYEILEQHTYTSKQSEIKFCNNDENTTPALFAITTINDNGDLNPFWVISDVRQCEDNGFRMIKLDEMANCQLMSPKSEVISLDNNISVIKSSSAVFNNCGEETVSKYCIPCQSFLNEGCKNLKICERYSNEFQCSCSAGYQTDYSDTINCRRCTQSAYGHACVKTCSQNCYNCDNADGSCSSCNNDYQGRKCDIPPIPIFEHAPTVPEIAYTNATVVVRKFDLLNHSSKSASYGTYTIQYKRTDHDGNQIWSTYPSNYIFGQIQSVPIESLQPGARYRVRAVFTRPKSYDINEIPFTEFTTKCDDVQGDDLYVEPSQTAAVLTVLEERKQFICRFRSPQVFIKPIHTPDEFSYRPKSFKIYLNGLRTFQNYTVTVKIGNHQITKSFRTTEGIPDVVKNLNGAPINDTTIKLNWQPGEIYGNLKSYEIKYQVARNLACDGDLVYGADFTVTSATTFTTVSALHPYTQYLFSVSAQNTKNTGGSRNVFVNTPHSETINDDEIPSIKPKKSLNRSVQLQFSEISCSNFRGPLLIKMTVTCSDQWCTKNTTQEVQYSGSSSSITISSVFPFSNYVFIFTFCRTNLVCSPIIKYETLRTDVESPSIVNDLSVYSKNSNSISIRWLPPYPPSGILELYNINLWLIDLKNRRIDSRNVSNSPCRLWPEYQCSTFTGLDGEQKYSVEMKAKNKNPDSLGQLRAIETVTKTEQSKPPPDLKLFWTLNNDLKITWKHPTEANGDISYFNISVLYAEVKQERQVRETLSLTKEQYAAEYDYIVPSNKLLSSTEYKITVRAFNGLYGEESYVTDFSPPEIPIFETEPKLETTNHSIEVETYKIKNFADPNSYKLFLLVSDEEMETMSHPAELQQFENNFRMRLSTFRNIYKCSLYNNTKKFIIGESNSSTANCEGGQNLALAAGTHYNVTILLVNNDLKKSSYKLYSYDVYTAGQGAGQAEGTKDLRLLALLALLLIIPIAIFIFFKRRPITEKLTSLKRNLFAAPSNDIEVPEEETPLETVPVMPKPTKKICSKKVKISNLEQYVKESLKSGELEKQHELFPRGQTKPWECGALKENKSKNRYANLIAYDHTRVVLKQSNGGPHSDYINANYIDGYQVPKAYIATQGPKMSTTGDFWKMIWQENVHHIAMLANVYEGGKKKVEKYWPDRNETLYFGGISVHFTSSRVYADYEHRIFNVVQETIPREVHQYHFSSWPDHGVPLYSQSLVPFLQTLQNIPLSSETPIVVHCSAGVGRTGTVILCDICLRMAAKENAVDMLKSLQTLRNQRPNMVDNIQQYRLAHLVILEYLLGMKTGIPCAEIHSEVKKLVESGELGRQLVYLENTAWQDQTMKGVVTVKDFLIVKEKNRIQGIVPEMQGYIFLSRYPSTDDSSTYINAVNVDGFQNPNRFIVTQQPMPNTLGDFWRLIHEKDISVILSLNEINLDNHTSCHFWPSESEVLKPVDYITIKHVSSLSLEFHDLISVHMYINESDENKSVEILALKNWPPKTNCPKALEAFLSFYEESNIAARQSKPVVVTCFDGALASGLYVALSFVIEKMKLEQICDVCQAVRNIRHNRSQFVRTEEQLEFLYQAADAYIGGFQSYANFT